ncbi:unnamed protein product [Prorocentrum cordatum]|uniref:Uncharacterized protein n=1 Tax=Prorocentrum cordatum TaxID=2364126 RepID=A0ABN9WPE7_9DINO|nr:unnamed protein product [Polarella glacialis]
MAEEFRHLLLALHAGTNGEACGEALLWHNTALDWTTSPWLSCHCPRELHCNGYQACGADARTAGKTRIGGGTEAGEEKGRGTTRGAGREASRGEAGAMGGGAPRPTDITTFGAGPVRKGGRGREPRRPARRRKKGAQRSGRLHRPHAATDCWRGARDMRQMAWEISKSSPPGHIHYHHQTSQRLILEAGRRSWLRLAASQRGQRPILRHVPVS